jgi:hypothetical protein
MSLKTKNIYLFILVVLVTITITFASSRLMLTRDAYYRTYGNQIDFIRLDQIFSFRTKIEWIVYLIIPVLVLIKMFMMSLCIQIGLLIQNLKLSLSQTFNITLTAEFVFFVPQIIKIFWFLLVVKNYTITEVQQFYPLSALNMFNANNIPIYLVYPFQTFNIFEILYCVFLAVGVKLALQKDLDNGLKVVFSGYIPGLFLWLLCITFITVLLVPTVKV